MDVGWRFEDRTFYVVLVVICPAQVLVAGGILMVTMSGTLGAFASRYQSIAVATRPKWNLKSTQNLFLSTCSTR